ncbi:MAG: hypothetical protein ACJAZP_000765 [Psychromonas sp.]|jgi:hypothetical protein
MTQSRQSQVSLSDTPYYHCISRCVRRAYLCGEDKYIEKSFEHRRQWVVDRMHWLFKALDYLKTRLLAADSFIFYD